MSDTMAMQMTVFNRSTETGALTVRQRLDVPGSPDNVEIDIYRGVASGPSLLSDSLSCHYSLVLCGLLHMTSFWALAMLNFVALGKLCGN